MQHPKKLQSKLHGARRQLKQCANALASKADKHKDLHTRVSSALDVIMRTLYLFHEQCPPQDSVVCELIRSAQELEDATFIALGPSCWTQAVEEK